MAEVLVLKLTETAGEATQWIVADSSGARLGPPVTGPLSAARVDIGDRRVVVLVPATDVLTTSVDLPVKSQVKIQQALPFALEEFVAEDVEELHFAAGTRGGDGRIPVSVVNRTKLEQWLAELAEAGIQPSALMAESYGLASIPGTISLLIAGDQVIVNDGAGTELVMQGIGPAEALAAIGAFDEVTEPDAGERDDRDEDESTAPSGLPRHVLAYCEPGADDRYQHEFNALRHDFESVDVKLLPDGVLPRLAVTVATGAGVNLLQGEFGAKAGYASMFLPWRTAALLLVGLGAVGVAGKALDYVNLSEREAELREQFMAEYREIAPGAAEVRDPAAVIASLQARSGSTAGASAVFLQSLEQLSLALQRNDGADIQAINYRGGVIDVRLSAPSVSVLDNVQRLIDESGAFAAEIQSTVQKEDGVDSRFQIQAVGS